MFRGATAGDLAAATLAALLVIGTALRVVTGGARGLRAGAIAVLLVACAPAAVVLVVALFAALNSRTAAHLVAWASPGPLHIAARSSAVVASHFLDALAPPTPQLAARRALRPRNLAHALLLGDLRGRAREWGAALPPGIFAERFDAALAAATRGRGDGAASGRHHHDDATLRAARATLEQLDTVAETLDASSAAGATGLLLRLAMTIVDCAKSGSGLVTVGIVGLVAVLPSRLLLGPLTKSLSLSAALYCAAAIAMVASIARVAELAELIAAGGNNVTAAADGSSSSDHIAAAGGAVLVLSAQGVLEGLLGAALFVAAFVAHAVAVPADERPSCPMHVFVCACALGAAMVPLAAAHESPLLGCVLIGALALAATCSDAAALVSIALGAPRAPRHSARDYALRFAAVCALADGARWFAFAQSQLITAPSSQSQQPGAAATVAALARMASKFGECDFQHLALAKALFGSSCAASLQLAAAPAFAALGGACFFAVLWWVAVADNAVVGYVLLAVRRYLTVTPLDEATEFIVGPADVTVGVAVVYRLVGAITSRTTVVEPERDR